VDDVKYLTVRDVINAMSTMPQDAVVIAYGDDSWNCMTNIELQDDGKVAIW
jgi:hypothetical protein